jgi:uridine kinase
MLEFEQLKLRLDGNESELRDLKDALGYDRLKRDIEERGRTIDSVISQYLTTVKPMYYQFVKPSKRHADIIIPNDSKHDVAVDILMAKLNQIINQ